ncbi:MAG: hypothetical protein P4L90_03185 [Rhodopila sp.]|nr:hypothetical protein [Rhodopila sp.]
MRRGFVLAGLLLPLSGCYVPPQGPVYGYAQPGYPPAADYGYAPQGYPPGGAQPAPYDPYGAAYPGYSYNDGAPTIIEGGITVPLVLLGSEWGYYDSERHWRRAPEGVSRRLEQQRAAGATFHFGGAPHPEGRPPPRPEGHPSPAAEPYRGQAPYHPGEQARPAAAPYGGPRTGPAPQPQREEHQREEHQRSRECPAGQRC